ncbi:hypothetical protein N657DRAFT_680089 [Parathielavia appendiculata]|uniref:Uncharacterized protein n=1 Tax=Parathielavia appendiculata TaxID=2587402 RepID=A0AAN6U2W4_9PEZI|nr:hypothetical protein N657DRAFT_680089 [Parathielavia appendiculata]
MPSYPGWNLDLRWTGPPDNHRRSSQNWDYPKGIHYNCVGAQSHMLLVREVAMMLVMDRLSDKPNWNVKIFDDEIAEKWKAEALAWPDEDLWKRIANIDHDMESRWKPKMSRHILNKESVDYVNEFSTIVPSNAQASKPLTMNAPADDEKCIKELRHKARHFERTGITPTLDATFSIAKSDVLVPRELHVALREAFAQLQVDQASNPDWHPNTNETVQDLVHPSMYPLVYGRSRFIPEEVVGVEDAVDKWAGKGDVIPRRPELGEEPARGTPRQWSRWNGKADVGVGGLGIHKSYWSTVYQWLPANVKFTSDGGVRFTSYINNLHPTKYGHIYTAIEKLLGIALPMWDQCLVQLKGWHKYGAGRLGPRIIPDNPDDENPRNWDPRTPEQMLTREAAGKPVNEAAAEAAMEPKQAPGKETDGSSSEEESHSDEDFSSDDEDDSDWSRWMKIRCPVQPNPPSFSVSKVKYAVDPAQTLRERFKEIGLQVIIKMASIELTPEKPEFAPGGWHVEGMMNEQIAATALYYLDSENITDSHLEFRAMTESDLHMELHVGQDSYHWMESVFGAKLGSGSGSACVQNYGSVLTPQGRLLAFPNIFHHRVSGFRLADPTKPGHRRFIALWLVDPSMRIVSTANVPPQQADWWAEQALGTIVRKKDEGSSNMPPEISQLLVEHGLAGRQLAEALTDQKHGNAKLPAELLDMVRKELGKGLPMSRKEAEEHRKKLMESRSAFQENARENWESAEYNFCEH